MAQVVAYYRVSTLRQQRSGHARCSRRRRGDGVVAGGIDVQPVARRQLVIRAQPVSFERIGLIRCRLLLNEADHIMGVVAGPAGSGRKLRQHLRLHDDCRIRGGGNRQRRTPLWDEPGGYNYGGRSIRKAGCTSWTSGAQAASDVWVEKLCDLLLLEAAGPAEETGQIKSGVGTAILNVCL